MPSIYPKTIGKKVVRGVWYVQIESGAVEGKRQRITKQVKGSKKDAELALARMLSARGAPEYVEPSKETVGQFLKRWLVYMEGRVAPSTLADYKTTVEQRLIPTLGKVLIQQLRATDIDRAEKLWLKEGRVGLPRSGKVKGKALSAKTVFNYHRVLCNALNHAKRWKVVESNVADIESMTPPQWDHAEMHTLAQDEALLLMRVLREDRHGAALHTLLGTGLRVGELIALRWKDVDLDLRSLLVVQQYDAKFKGFRDVKSHRSRRPVAFDGDLAAELRAHRVQQKERQLKAGERWQQAWRGKECCSGCHDGRVFTDDLGHRITHTTLRYALNRCLKVAELGHINRHGLRHTHASLLIRLGASMKLVQERLGHSNYSITADTYSHIAEGAQHAAAELFGAALRRKEISSG